MKTRFLTKIFFVILIVFGINVTALSCWDCDPEERPDLCHECVDGVWVDTCVSCEICVYDECEDIQCAIIQGNCQRCNKTTGECEYSCSDEGCGEICVDNECVPDCDPVGSTCDWTSPPVQSGCPYTSIDDLSCAAGITGLLCDWKVVRSYSHSATGPCKVSGGFCVMLEPVLCEDKFILTLGMVCGCIGTPDLVEFEFLTPMYKCPDDPF